MRSACLQLMQHPIYLNPRPGQNRSSPCSNNQQKIVYLPRAIIRSSHHRMEKNTGFCIMPMLVQARDVTIADHRACNSSIGKKTAHLILVFRLKSIPYNAHLLLQILTNQYHEANSLSFYSIRIFTDCLLRRCLCNARQKATTAGVGRMLKFWLSPCIFQSLHSKIILK